MKRNSISFQNKISSDTYFHLQLDAENTSFCVIEKCGTAKMWFRERKRDFLWLSFSYIMETSTIKSVIFDILKA